MAAIIGTDLVFAKQLLEANELVAIPTETVYGLAGNALDTTAISKIFEVKNRPTFDPLIIHLPQFEQAERYVKHMPTLAWRLAQTFMPGPLTILLEKQTVIPDLVTAGSPFVAIRVPKHPLTQQLLQSIDFPLAAPSANPFGYISPTRPQHVFEQLGNKISYILDGGACTIGLESTIIAFPDDQPTILRKGGITIEAIEAVIGQVSINAYSTSNPSAPGMLKSHYAPRKPLIVGNIEILITQYPNHRLGVLSFTQSYTNTSVVKNIVLSSTGLLSEAAHHFFDALRQLDALDLDYILADWFPNEGLGRALNDKLKRASV